MTSEPTLFPLLLSPPVAPVAVLAFQRSRTRPASGGNDLLEDTGGHLVAVVLFVFSDPAIRCPVVVIIVVVVDDEEEDAPCPPVAFSTPGWVVGST